MLSIIYLCYNSPHRMHIWCDIMSKAKTNSKYKAHPGNGLQHHHKSNSEFLLCLYSKLGNLEKRKEKIRKKKRFMAGDWTSKIPTQIFTMGRLKVAKYYFTCAM